MRIGIIGARAIPARWGGFETVVSELAPRLVERGHDVTVYCRKKYALPAYPREFNGVRLRYVPAIETRSLESITHEALCALDCLRRSFDAVYVLGMRASLVHLVIRLSGRPVVMNTDGFDWQRRKWGALARVYLKMSELVAARLVASHLICDSRSMMPYYREAHHRSPIYIGYGANVTVTCDVDLLSRYGLQPGSYYLVVARLEPENNVDIAIREHEASGTAKPLVIVGATNYATDYVSWLHESAGPAVRFLGGIYEPGHIEAIYMSAYAYIHGHEVGGTNPALLHAMGCGCAVIAMDVVYNREVLGSAGLYFTRDRGSLASCIRSLDQSPASAAGMRDRARERVVSEYSWDGVADEYDRFFASVRG